MFYFIVNPVSKTGSGLAIWRRLKKILEEENVSYKAFATTKELGGDVIIRRLLDKIKTEVFSVVVLGGDGTFNEVLQGISKHEFGRLRVGYIPTGSSNDFAKALGYTDSPEEILRHIIHSNAYRAMDLGLVTYNKTETLGYKNRYFVVSAGIGYDAAVCHEALNAPEKKLLNKLHLGKLSYGLLSIKQLMTVRRPHCEMTIDGCSYSYDKCYFVVAMNEPFQGGGIAFCPNASDSDGMLNTCFAQNISRGRILYTLPFAYYGKHIGKKGIGNDLCKDIRIVFDEPLWVHTDGEVKTRATDITISCLPGIMNFIV